VALNPVRKATLDIPVIRYEIEGKGQSYRHSVLSRERSGPSRPLGHPGANAAPGRVKSSLHLVTLHLADGKPYVFGDRWINPAADAGHRECGPMTAQERQ
jgi:GntR family histidine utilization transcriptional repressor